MSKHTPRKMLDAVREEWAEACDGDYLDMANWAIKWGNPIMDAMERRVLNGELLEVLREVAETIEKSDAWWMVYPDKGGFDLEKIEAAISKAEGNHG